MDLMFFLILAVMITGQDMCNIQVCLTWNLQHNFLDIRCRVNYLRFRVEIVNNQKKEQGFCIHPRPTPKCYTSYYNTLIMQSSITNVTYLRIQGEIDSHVNGQWECKHGTNIDSATINVTVISLARRYIRTFMILLMLALFLLPVLKGVHDYNNCKDGKLHIICGVTIALLFPFSLALGQVTERGNILEEHRNQNESNQNEEVTSSVMLTNESPAAKSKNSDERDNQAEDDTNSSIVTQCSLATQSMNSDHREDMKIVRDENNSRVTLNRLSVDSIKGDEGDKSPEHAEGIQEEGTHLLAMQT